MLKHAAAIAIVVTAAALAGSAQQPPDTATGILASIDAKKDQYSAVAGRSSW